MKGRAIGYVRVSTMDQATGYSPDHQQQLIRSWAVDRGVELVNIIDGCGESGKDLDRKGLQQVLDRLALGDIGWLVVARLDRLSRNLEDTSWFLDTLDQDGILLASVSQYPDGTQPRLITLIHGFFAQMERESILARSRPGMQARVDAGLPLGPVPFGYRVQEETVPAGNPGTGTGTGPGPSPGSGPAVIPTGRRIRTKRLVPDSGEAEVIREVFALALQGWGSRRLATHVAKRWPQHSPTPGMIDRMLRNRIYTGALATTVFGQKVYRPDNHDPVIDMSVFWAVQEQLAHRRQDRAEGCNHAAADSLLGGLASCGCCGKVLVRRGAQYVCSSRTSAPPACALEPLDMQGLDAHVWKALEDVLRARGDRLRTAVDQAVDQLPTHLDERRRQAHAVRGQLASNEAQMVDRFACGEMDDAAFATAMEHLEGHRRDADRLLAAVDGDSYLAQLICAVERQEGVDAGTKDSSTRPRHRLRWLTLQEGLTHLDLPERRRLVHALVEDLTVIAAYPFCRFNTREDDGAWELLAQGWSRMLAHHPGHDLEGAMEQAGCRPDPLSTPSSASSTVLVADGLSGPEKTSSAENKAPFPKSGNSNDPIIIRAGTTWIRERQVQEDVGEPIRLRLQLSWMPPLPPPPLPTTVEGSQP